MIYDLNRYSYVKSTDKVYYATGEDSNRGKGRVYYATGEDTEKINKDVMQYRSSNRSKI
jgi:hypothetical protein